MRTVVLVLVLALVVIGGSAWAQDSAPARVRLPKKQYDVITQDEIETIRGEVSNAYDIIVRLRRQYFKNRVQGQIGESNWSGGPRVVLDEMPYGALETLRNIETAAIKEIRYLGGTEASMRFGNEFQGGAIVVVTR